MGTAIEKGKEVREMDGKKVLLEKALHGDVALVRASIGDTFGNLRFWRTAHNFSPVMAMAAKVTMAEVDSLVDVGGIDPDDVHLPGIFVQKVVEVLEHENPFEYKMNRPKPKRRQRGD